MQTLIDFFGIGSFIPHGFCLSWNPFLLWLHVTSDVLIAISYYSIPITLAYFIRKRKDFPYAWLILMAATFIVACGTTHLMSAILVWIPIYWLDGYLKAFTAIISVATAIATVKIIPNALQLPSAEKLQSQINQRKIDELLQQEASEQLYKITNQIPSFLFKFLMRADGSFCVPYANEALRTVYQTNFEALQKDASPLFALFHTDDLEKCLSEIRKSALYLTMWNGEYRLKFKNDEERWIAGNAIPHHQEDGSTLWYGFFSDVTERKKMEIHLRASETRFRKTFENAAIGVINISCDGRYLAVNKTYCDIVGYSREELLTMTVMDVTQEKDRATYFELIKQLCTGGIDNFCLEKQYIRRDKGLAWGSLSFQLVKDIDSETADYIIATIEDITERKKIEFALRESEQKIRDEEAFISGVLDSLAMEIVVLNTEGIIISANHAWNKIAQENKPAKMCTDKNKNQTMIGLNYLNVCEKSLEHPDGEYALNAHDGIKNVMNGTEPFFSMEYPCHTPMKQRWFLMTVSPLKSEKGTGGVVVSHEEITHRKKTELELQRSNTELEQFAYAISHDMRQPLRMVASYLSLIESALESKLDEDTRQFIDFAVGGAKRMDSMILSLLDYSRVGRFKNHFAVISSRECVEEALAFLKCDIEKNNGHVDVLGDWINLVMNPDELTRLLQNLIGNALKYHDENQPPLVEVRATIVNEQTFRVEIKDTGIGISPNQIERLFKVFSRLQSHSRFEGTGVGLALCRKIVEHYNGNIGVTSEGEGLGSLFWFEIPLMKSIEPDDL